MTNSASGTTVKVTTLPDCDICKITKDKKVPARYDGRTKGGRWAYMCPTCYGFHGVGLGTGSGQYLDDGS